MKEKNWIKLVVLFILISGIAIYLAFSRGYFCRIDSLVSLDSDKENDLIDFSLMDINGEYITLSEIESEFYLINFWAVRCPYCIIQIEDLVDLNNIYSKDTLSIFGISLDSNINEIKTIKKRYNIGYFMLISDDFTPWKFGGVSGIPTSFLLDSRRGIIKRYIGLTSKEEIDQDLKKFSK